MATQIELAEYWGVSDKTVYDLGKKGIISVPTKRGGYDIQKCTQQWLTYLRNKVIGKVKSETEPEVETQESRKSRLANDEKEINIELKKVKLFQETRKWAPVDFLEYALEQFSDVTKTQVETWVPKIKRACPDIPLEALKVIERTGVKCKNELANLDVPLEGYVKGGEDLDPEWAQPIEIEDTDYGE